MTETVCFIITAAVTMFVVFKCDKALDKSIASIAMHEEANKKCMEACYPNLGKWAQLGECICEASFRKKLP